MDIDKMTETIYFGSSVIEYAYAVIAFFVAFILLLIIKYIFVRVIKNIAEKTEYKTDDLVLDIARTFKWPLFALVAFYLSFKLIEIPEFIAQFIKYTAIALIAYYIVKVLQLIIDFITENTLGKKIKDKYDKVIVDFIIKIVKVGIWTLAFLIFIQNLGYNVTAIVAGFGIGGIAIAFALQNVLGDLFASLSIYFDKPYKVGDYISIGKDHGNVKKIGLKSTRLKTLNGETLIISNKEISESRVHNYHKIEKRRVSFKIGVTYDTPIKKLKKIPDMIEEIASSTDDVEFKWAHFRKFGDNALMFGVVYHVLTRKFDKYLDIKQEINYKIKEAFEKEKIEIAYPTQTLFIKK